MMEQFGQVRARFAERIGRSCLLACMCLLTGCAGDSDIAQVASLLYRGLSESNTKIPRETAAAVPFATMGIAFGSSPQALLILGATMNEELDWYAGDQVFVATRHGRVIRTVGLPYDLGGAHLLSTASGAPAVGNAQATDAMTLDFPDLGVFDAAAKCSSKIIGDDDVEILGARVATRHIVEHCEVTVLRWKFYNDFWQDRMTGYVWRSRQYIHPKSPPLVLEVLRPEQTGPG